MLEVVAKPIVVSTASRWQIVDVTQEVKRLVQESNVKTGFALIWVPHTTAAIVINEHDGRLWEDLLTKLSELAPVQRNYRHNGEGNAHAHILNTLLGHEVCIPIEEGELALGTWQSILLIEMDGPRRRHLIARIYH